MDSRELVLSVECERLRADVQRVNRENAVLRPMVAELLHKLKLAEKRAPVAPKTDPLIRKNREHA